MNKNSNLDLGFSFIILKNGDIEIRHQGKHATQIRSKSAVSTIVKLENGSVAQQQQLMARLTGNYKQGNESAAKAHFREKYQQGP
jgi:hypothetical protein